MYMGMLTPAMHIPKTLPPGYLVDLILILFSLRVRLISLYLGGAG